MRNASPEPDDLQRLWVSLRADVVRFGADEQTAEDVVQETWLRALRNPPEDRQRLYGWLHVVARRLLREIHVSSRHRRQREQAVARRDEVSEGILEEGHALLRYLDELPEPYISAMRLRFMEGRPVPEIAQILRRPPETVRSQIKRGLERLRTRVGERDDRRVLGLAAVLRARLAAARRLGSRLTTRRSALIGLGAAAAWIVVVLSSDPERTTPSFGGNSSGIAGAEPRTPIEVEADSRISLDAQQAASPLAPAARTFVAGTVRTPDGTPLPGARVHAAAHGAPESGRSVLSDAHGRYEIDVETEHELLWSTHEEWRPSRRSYAALALGRRDADIVLSATAGRSSVRVVDAGGAPVAGAEILLAPFETFTQKVTSRGMLEYEPPRTSVITDEQGRAEVLLPEEQALELLVRAEGLPACTARIEQHGEELTITLPRPTVVRGTCRDEHGRALANACVEVLQLGGLSRVERVSGPDGVFEVVSLSPGPFVLRAIEDSAVVVRSARHQESLDEGGRLDLELVLSADATIHGWATQGGRPLAGARVALRALKAVEAEGREERTFFTDAGGRFAFGGCASRDAHVIHLSEARSGYRGESYSPLFPGPDELALVLGDEPLALAPIVVRFAGAAERAPRWIEVNGPAQSRALAHMQRSTSSLVGSEDGSGLFRSVPLPAGEYEVVGWHPEFGTYPAGRIDHVVESASEQVLCVPERGSLAFELVLAPGMVVDGVEVAVRVPGFGNPGLGELARETATRELEWNEQKLAFTGDFAAGDYEFVVRGAGIAAYDGTVHVDGGSENRITVVPEAARQVTLAFRSPRPLHRTEALDVVLVSAAKETRLALATASFIAGFECLLWLPDGTIEIRARSRARQGSLPSDTRLEGQRTLASSELLEAGTVPRIEIELTEWPE